MMIRNFRRDAKPEWVIRFNKNELILTEMELEESQWSFVGRRIILAHFR
jgi:hypothetical protein